MPLAVDLEASIEESCAEILQPWAPLADDEVLDLGGFEEALRTITGHDRPLRALRIVDESPDVIAVERLRALIALPAVHDIEVLMLPMCKLGKQGAEVLAGASLRKLRLLDVRATAIGDAGGRALATSPLASRLEYLAVAGAYLEVGAFQALLDSPLGKRRRSLHIEEEDQGESVMPTLLARLYDLGKGDEAMVERAFFRLLDHPALTKESSDELRYQWELIAAN